MKRSRSVKVGIGTAVLASIALGGTAGASPYGNEPGAPGYVPDSSDHWFCFDASVPSQYRFYYQWAMDNLDIQSAPIYDVESGSCGWATDVKMIQASLSWVGSGVIGYAPCVTRAWNNNMICEAGEVWNDAALIFANNGGFGGSQSLLDHRLHHNVRHEVGHTAGMAHYNTGGPHAVYSGLSTGAAGYHAYRGHDICHLNGWSNNQNWTGCK